MGLAWSRRASLVAFLLLGLTGCGPTTDMTAPPLGNRLVGSTPTPLATEPPSLAAVTPKPKATLKPTATKSPSSGAYYRPPGWDGTSDVNCSDFDTHAHAVSFFKGTGGSSASDPYSLDGDHDGNPCETLP